ncbi:MAG: pyroglutamyl-peptidase I [Microbacteriaceae bacterium]
MTTVLLTGFEPFAGAAVNPSWDAVERVARDWSGPETVVAVRLPVEFGRVDALLEAAVAEHSPDVLIAVGLAEGRDAITPERIGINVDDARIPDNAGDQRIDSPIEADGPAARFSTLPIKAIVEALRAAGVPATVSSTAGTFVCNHVAYAAPGLSASRPGLRAGFVHVPATPELGAHASVPTLELATIVDGLRIAVETAVRTTTDVAAVGGSIH